MRNFARVRWVAALVMACALSAGARASFLQSTKAPHKRDLRAEVEAVDKQWSTALETNDIATMEKLLAEDYLGITGSGEVFTKSQQLDRMRSHATAVTRLDISDQKVKLIGTQSAIVTSQAVLEGTMDGHPIHGNFRSVRVYKRVGAAWQVTSFQATPERDRGL